MSYIQLVCASSLALLSSLRVWWLSYSHVSCMLHCSHSHPVYLSPTAVIHLEIMMTANITTVVAGVVFVLISFLWPCSWVWDRCNRDTGCSYTPLVCYSWLLSLLYFGVIGALVTSVIEHRDCIYSCNDCPNNSTGVDNWCDMYVRVPFFMLAVMVALAVGFILLSCVCCTCISCERETRRTGEQ